MPDRATFQYKGDQGIAGMTDELAEALSAFDASQSGVVHTSDLVAGAKALREARGRSHGRSAAGWVITELRFRFKEGKRTQNPSVPCRRHGHGHSDFKLAKSRGAYSTLGALALDIR